jgi:hypothetical protein
LARKPRPPVGVVEADHAVAGALGSVGIRHAEAGGGGLVPATPLGEVRQRRRALAVGRDLIGV